MIGDMIADSLKFGLSYSEKLLAGVSPSQFSQFARVDGRLIESNHPAWVFGHLSLYPARIVGELGGDNSNVLPSDQWMELFSAKGKCQDDPDGKIYPPMDQIVAKFSDSYRAAEQALRSAPDEAFAQPSHNEAMRSRFATVGAIHDFYVNGHLMLHMGQISAWRRMMGLGPA